MHQVVKRAENYSVPVADKRLKESKLFDSQLIISAAVSLTVLDPLLTPMSGDFQMPTWSGIILNVRRFQQWLSGSGQPSRSVQQHPAILSQPSTFTLAFGSSHHLLSRAWPHPGLRPVPRPRWPSLRYPGESSIFSELKSSSHRWSSASELQVGKLWWPSGPKHEDKPTWILWKQ